MRMSCNWKIQTTLVIRFYSREIRLATHYFKHNGNIQSLITYPDVLGMYVYNTYNDKYGVFNFTDPATNMISMFNSHLKNLPVNTNPIS